MSEHYVPPPKIETTPETEIFGAAEFAPDTSARLPVPDTLAPGLDISHPEAGFLGLETMKLAVDSGRLAVRGLVRFLSRDLASGAERDVKGLTKSAAVHKEYPAAYQHPKRGKAVTGPYPWQEFPEHKRGAKYYRVIKPSLRAETFLQERQAKRAARRQSRANVKRSGEQYRLKQIYGEDLGKKSYDKRIERARMSPRLKRQAKKVNKSNWGITINPQNRYGWNEKKINKKVELVQRSRRGEDIPGRFISWRKNKEERFATKRRDKLANTEAAFEAERQRLAQEREQKWEDTKDTAKRVGRGIKNLPRNTRGGYRAGRAGTAPSHSRPQRVVNRIARGSGRLARKLKPGP